MDISHWPIRAVILNLNGRVIERVSRGFAQSLGQTCEQCVEQCFDHYLTAASRLYFLSAFDPKLRNGEDLEQHTLNIKMPNGTIPFLVSAQPQASNMALLVLMPADRHLMLQRQLIQERNYTEQVNRELIEQQRRLTAQKNRQKRLLQTLERTNYALLQTEKMAALGQLAAGIAHEINNPVSYIRSNLNCLNHDVTELLAWLSQLPESTWESYLSAKTMAQLQRDLADSLSESQQGIEHITSITQALTQFTRAPGKKQCCELHQQLNTTLRVLKTPLKEKAKISRDYAPMTINVRFDPAQLNQVLMNVLLNAAQAIERFGQITLCTRIKDNAVAVIISDTGVGMDKQTLARACEPFYTTKAEGTGLGLALVHNMLRRHAADLDIVSTPGKGTTVTLRLPLVLSTEENE